MIIDWTSGARDQSETYRGGMGWWATWSAVEVVVAPAAAFIDVTLLLHSTKDITLGVQSVLDRTLQRLLG